MLKKTIVIFIFVFFGPVLFCFFGGMVSQSAACLVLWAGKTSSFFTPSAVSTLEKESCFLSGELGSLARYAWVRGLKTPWDWAFWIAPSSESSWSHYRDLLSQAPIASDKDRELVRFLEQRWLSKASGFFPLEAKWLCPFFGIQVQTHPETTDAYARDPSRCHSKTYTAKVEMWKRFLPHPPCFPLILTRPSDIHEYLPNCLVVSPVATVEAIVDQLVDKTIQSEGLTARTTEIVVDLTHILPAAASSRQSWLSSWKAFQIPFYQLCKKHRLDLSNIVCIQRLQQGTIGGIRLLPISSLFGKEIALQDRILSDWISCFGLTANKVELERGIPNIIQDLAADAFRSPRFAAGEAGAEAGHVEDMADGRSCKDGASKCVSGQILNDVRYIGSTTLPKPVQKGSSLSDVLEKEQFLSDLTFFHQQWQSPHPQKQLMVEATVRLLKGLIDIEADWENIFACPTKAFIAKLSFFEIGKQLDLLIKEKETSSFFEVASRIEQIHSHLSSLLEISLPFARRDFPAIHERLLGSFPSILKPFIQYGTHSSAMTSLTGILRAVQQQAGSSFRILYGENSYFEAIQAVSLVSRAHSVSDAAEEDWKEADLILTQFNPVLKRDDVHTAEYKLENTVEQLRNVLDAGRRKPLTLAIDCTIDFLNSPRIHQVLELFQKEIKEGILNIICFRSGLKFDLLGMDNYCASPFFMIHNQSWDSFNFLLTDPALQTDLLSLNWFCLAYKYAAPQLDLYRKQIFDNTRALLNRIPPKLYDQNAVYRITPMREGTDPAFIEMKVFGPMHRMRASAILGGGLYLRCLREGLPIFCRRSFGFYHANFGLLFGEKSSSMRLTVGLDPADIDTLAACFEDMACF